MAAWIQTYSGIVLPSPSLGESGVSISTLVSDGRNLQGNFIGQIIGKDKLKYEMKFGGLYPEEFMNLLRVFDREQGGKFMNDFWVMDPRTHKYVLKTMYVGDRSGTPLSVNSDMIPTFWGKVQANLIEV